MGSDWIGLVFWLLIGASIVLFVIGLFEKSWKTLLISGTAQILPALYFLGNENWLKAFSLVPLITFMIAYYIRRKTSEPIL